MERRACRLVFRRFGDERVIYQYRERETFDFPFESAPRGLIHLHRKCSSATATLAALALPKFEHVQLLAKLDEPAYFPKLSENFVNGLKRCFWLFMTERTDDERVIYRRGDF